MWHAGGCCLSAAGAWAPPRCGLPLLKYFRWPASTSLLPTSHPTCAEGRFGPGVEPDHAGHGDQHREMAAPRPERGRHGAEGKHHMQVAPNLQMRDGRKWPACGSAEAFWMDLPAASQPKPPGAVHRQPNLLAKVLPAGLGSVHPPGSLEWTPNLGIGKGGRIRRGVVSRGTASRPPGPRAVSLPLPHGAWPAEAEAGTSMQCP